MHFLVVVSLISRDFELGCCCEDLNGARFSLRATEGILERGIAATCHCFRFLRYCLLQLQ